MSILGTSEEEEEFNNSLGQKSLIAYRLGRVEKAVELNNQHAVDRDEKLMTKLESFTVLTTAVSTHTLRIEALETSRRNMVNYLAGVSITLLGVVVSLLVGRM